VLSALPTYALADLLPGAQRQLVDALRSVRYTSVATVNIGFRDALDAVPPEWRSFGYLAVPSECSPLLGVTFDSFTFAQHQSAPGELRLTAMIGGDPDLHDNSLDVADRDQQDDDALIAIALAELRKHMPNVIGSREPCYTHVARCIRSIPYYQVGHYERLDTIEQLSRSLPMSLLGNQWGVGVNDCIARSHRVVDDLVNQVS
jgi:protoporphyrinogen/coproporphyrinogen III oxidase